MTINKQTAQPLSTKALWGGVIFSLLFTGLIWLVGGRLDTWHATFLPDTGYDWYWWQLPEKNWGARLTAWGFYLAHQFAIWGIIFYAQRNKSKYTSGLHNFNYWALGANAFFIFLHLIQTHVWYDALAQDVSVSSSQGSVIIMLVMVLMMETPRRGLFLGQKVWAIIYTFWYHPTVATSGHLIGFFYTFLLMVQSSLFFTRAHMNRWWTFSLEVIVLVHATLVAIGQASDIWPMFFFGFAGIVVLTQIHGLGLSRLTRGLIIAAYIGSALWVYNERGLEKINEIIRIPFIEYLAVYVIAFIITAIIWLVQRIGSIRQISTEQT